VTAGDRYARDYDAYILEGRYLNFGQALDYLDDKGFEWHDAVTYLRLLWTDAFRAARMNVETR
jgi:hypothetical protein